MYNFTAKAPSIIEMEKPGKSMSPDNLYFDNIKANINKSNFLPELKITKKYLIAASANCTYLHKNIEYAGSTIEITVDKNILVYNNQ